MAKKEIFYGIDAISGSTRFFCPGVFIGKIKRIDDFFLESSVIISEDRLFDAYCSLINNNLDYRYAYEFGYLEKSLLSKKVEKKFMKYSKRGLYDKSLKLIAGYVTSFYYNQQKLRMAGLSSINEAVVGTYEKSELENVKGYVYPSKNAYVLAIPNYFFAIYENGQVRLASDKFLSEASSYVRTLEKENLAKSIYINKGYLNKIICLKDSNKREWNLCLKALIEKILRQTYLKT